MPHNSQFKVSNNNETGTKCFESGTYCCHLHPYIERHIHEGDNFPKCDKGIGHNTNWWKKIN